MNKKFTLYEEAKSSLKKFKGDSGVQNEKSSIKLEPAYLAENEEALLAAGYVKANPKAILITEEALDGIEVVQFGTVVIAASREISAQSSTQIRK